MAIFATMTLLGFSLKTKSKFYANPLFRYTVTISVTDSQTIKTASFIDLNHGWIVKGHSILDTEDGGFIGLKLQISVSMSMI